MRINLLASLTSKVVVGVAAGTLAAGSAGAAVLTQSISDDQPAAVESTVEGGSTDADATDELDLDVTDLEDEAAEDADDAAEDADDAADDADTLDAFDEEVDTSTPKEHPDNFGKIVSERAHSEGGNKGGVADLAHEKNAERKAGGGDAEDADDESDDAADEAETSTSHGRSGERGKGKNK